MSRENLSKRRKLIDEDATLADERQVLFDQKAASIDEDATSTSVIDEDASVIDEDAPELSAAVTAILAKFNKKLTLWEDDINSFEEEIFNLKQKTLSKDDVERILEFSAEYSFFIINVLLQKKQSVSKPQLMKSFIEIDIREDIDYDGEKEFLTTSVDNINMWLEKEENNFTQDNIIAIIDKITSLGHAIEQGQELIDGSIISILSVLKSLKSDFYYDKSNQKLQPIIQHYQIALDSDSESEEEYQSSLDEQPEEAQPDLQAPETPPSPSLSTPPTQESGAAPVAGDTPTILESSGAGPSRQTTLQAPQALQVGHPQSQHSSQH